MGSYPFIIWLTKEDVDRALFQLIRCGSKEWEISLQQKNADELAKELEQVEHDFRKFFRKVDFTSTCTPYPKSHPFFSENERYRIAEQLILNFMSKEKPQDTPLLLEDFLHWLKTRTTE